ncbi:hypothetical protein JCM1840_000911 [Sporobolomyces johnsonii]
MPLFPAFPAKGHVPILNSACPWASSAEDLKALWDSPATAAVTTRTCTLRGFADDPTKHQVVFFGPLAQSTANSFGYSPYPIAQYLDWLRPLVRKDPKRKQVIVSIAGTLDETDQMLVLLQRFATELGVTIAAEYNASCPNFRGRPPPAYVESELAAFVAVLAQHASPTLKVGVKLPPYTYDAQFDAVMRALSSIASATKEHPVSFLTATNTLGQGLVFSEQIVDVPSRAAANKPIVDLFALPGGWGGVAGAAIHQTSLGNVHRLSSLLLASPDRRLRSISLIGVGGACDAAGVERFRRAGACAVACATGLGREGVSVFSRMKGDGVKL